MSRRDPATPSADDPGSLPGFETLISELSSRFINPAPGEVDGEIENARRRVCAPLGIDRALLDIESAPGRGTTVAAWAPVETASP